MSSSRRMDHMTWPEIEASKSKPVIVPIGSTEQHSQHLPPWCGRHDRQPCV